MYTTATCLEQILHNNIIVVQALNTLSLNMDVQVYYRPLYPDNHTGLMKKSFCIKTTHVLCESNYFDREILAYYCID